MEELTLYILHTSIVKDNYSSLLSMVDKNRIEKANRFVNENDQLLSLGGGYLLTKYLPHLEMKYNENGKPYLANGPYFNLSHSKDYVVLAISHSREVGVDIEYIDENKVKAIKYSLSEEEKDISDINTLFQIWSNKESLIKCLGSSISDIKKIKGLPLEGVREGRYSKSMIYDGYSLSITLNGQEPFSIKIKEIKSLCD